MHLHHAAIIVSSEKCLAFYQCLGFNEEKRLNRGYDQIVWMSGNDITLEIFIDPKHPQHVTNPEALGLRHLAFEVENIDETWNKLMPYSPETIKLSPDGSSRVFFVKDLDGLPIEIGN